MINKMSRQELIAIAELLLAADSAPRQGLHHLIDEFEANVPWPEAADLIFDNKDEFKSAAECVDFLLGRERKRRLSRDELIEVTRKLMFADVRNEVESARLSGLFEANVPHPDGLDLIFWPKVEFDTPEALVDYALSYKAPKG
jgi:hypothetical protein